MEPAIPQNGLSDFLRQYRQEHDLTVQELAQRCQIPMATLIGLEYGDRPTDEDLEAIARGIDLPLRTLVRASIGEAVEIRLPAHESPSERPSTLLEAIQGLTPSQIEKAKDYIQYLRWAERQASEKDSVED
jgi:transcriptional regulator with XRE-family HTH domain